MAFLRRAFPSQSSSISTSLLLLLLLYSFSSQFLPIEPYMVPYLTTVKHFTNFQVTVDIFPLSVYAQLVFTLLMAPACLYLSHKVVIVLGAFGILLTYFIAWMGESLLSMQFMQVTYGFGAATRLAFSSYTFLVVPEEEYQAMTSVTTTTSLLSFMFASELSQLLAFEKIPYVAFFVLTFISLGVCCSMALLLPKDRSSSLFSTSFAHCFNDDEGLVRTLKKTWHGRDLQILSLWWAVAYAGFSLVQNYGTNLFYAIDSNSKLNGHIIAASQAAGSLGAFCAVYLENFASQRGMIIYVMGLAFMAILCVFMGISARIWVVYLIYVTISGIYQTLACLLTVRCGHLLSNKQFILLFSFNSFTGLLLETILQAVLEISRLSVFAQFSVFGGFFSLATMVFIFLCFFGRSSGTPELESEPEPLVSEWTY
ncbi:hypothetical protein H6P81_019768 [Aristolochia fimbriata]|uniref:Uncharacterized protein n=1 Tax=Aristolochia fimbriata TaxID=158543 RepID=A0AAV7DTM2_ARIFI|nr:hypothetical protein H6P81_019768 [Aristolochia fimbriata]